MNLQQSESLELSEILIHMMILTSFLDGNTCTCCKHLVVLPPFATFDITQPACSAEIEQMHFAFKVPSNLIDLLLDVQCVYTQEFAY